jgi:hypothetical protein
VSSAGLLVTATASASGTLGGTTTATTNASGTAAFTGLTVTGITGDVFTITFSAPGVTAAVTGSLTFAFFDIQTQPVDAASLTQSDNVRSHDSAFGTKPVAVHTLGLRTFSGGYDRFADRARAAVELPTALLFSR